MKVVQKLTVIALALGLLLVLGTGIGAWLATYYYRPLLDTANTELMTAKLVRNSLEELAEQQGRKLDELVSAGDQRARNAAQAIAKAKEESRPDYTAANRLLWRQIGGDPAAAAASIIDQELEL